MPGTTSRAPFGPNTENTGLSHNAGTSHWRSAYSGDTSPRPAADSRGSCPVAAAVSQPVRL